MSHLATGSAYSPHRLRCVVCIKTPLTIRLCRATHHTIKQIEDLRRVADESIQECADLREALEAARAALEDQAAAVADMARLRRAADAAARRLSAAAQERDDAAREAAEARVGAAAERAKAEAKIAQLEERLQVSAPGILSHFLASLRCYSRSCAAHSPAPTCGT